MTDRYASLKQGLVGCWIPSVSGSGLLLPDLSGRGNNGALTNMDASDWVSSGNGRALDFDGSNDRVTLGTQSLSNSARTVSGWMRLNATGINHALLDGSTDTSVGRGLHLRITNGNVLRFWNYDANGNATGATVLSSGIWYHVCGTFDGATTNRVYLNGVFDGSNTGDSTNSVSGSFNIGASTLLNYFTNGSIDDIRVYNRALSESEIRLLSSEPGIGFKPAKKLSRFSQRFTYNPPKARNYGVLRVKETDYATLRQGLVGAWCPSLPNGGSGNTLPDVSGYGNHGVLTNMGPEDWVSGQYGRALDFDGVNDVVSCPQVPFTGTGNFSISIWVLQGTIRADDHAIKFGTASLNNAVGIFNGSGNNLTIGLHANIASEASLTANLATNVFYHIVGICTPTRRQIWLNGVLHGTSTTTVNYDITSTFCNIGAAQSTLVPWNGRLDDIRVYSRVLTESEIRLLASRPGVGLRQESHRNTFYQFPSGARRKRILTGMP